MSEEVSLPRRIAGPGINTQRDNMNIALEHVSGDFIFVLEDDDFYAPNYLREMLSAFSNSDIVGLGNAKYYKMDMPGFTARGNFSHASLSQTAIKRSLLPLLKEAVNSGEFYFDVKLWDLAKQQKLPMTLISNTLLSIGVKGMPGRKGLTPAHKDNKGFLMDTGEKVFQEWFGTFQSLYRPFLKNRVVKR